MTPAIDLDAYFKRIDYTGERAPTLAALRAIHLRHPRAIAFENLNPLLGWPVRLDAPSLEQKLVRDGRGGYCFEHNLLLAHALAAMGFRVTCLAARVLWNRPEGAITPRTHMLLGVDDIDGVRYIADVGFGGLTLTAPLRLAADVEQDTPHENFRLLESADRFTLQANVRGTWKPLYRFDLHEQLLPDYEVTNWYLSNHPQSPFVTGLMAARPETDRRYALLNNALTIHYLDGRSERRVLKEPAALRAVLVDVFGLTLPPSPEIHAAFERLIARAESAAST